MSTVTTSGKTPTRSSLTGTVTLLRFMLRRDRIRTTAWVGGIAILALYFAHAVQAVAESQEELASLAGLFVDPVGRLMVGPGFGMEEPTHERFFASGYALYLYIPMALFSAFTVIRHTRVEEQMGRAELIRSNVVGRHATLTAALLLTTVANLVMSALIFVAAVSAGFATEGSLLVAAAGFCVGLFFTAVAATAAQLSQSSRGASGIAGGLLGVAYVIRMAGDMPEAGGTTLSWFSPLAWSQQTAPYVYDRWWPLLLLVGGAIILTALGFWLSTKRDLDASLIPTRLGRNHASPRLGTPWGVAAKTLGGSLRGWGIALVIAGLMFGAYAQSILDTADTLPEEFAQLFAGEDLMLGYLAYMALFMAVFTAAAGVSGLQQVRGEETSGRAEYTLSVPMSRTVWFIAHIGLLVIAMLVILAVVGAAMGLAAATFLQDDGLQYFGQIFLASMMQAPAVLAVVGIGALCFGWAPRLLAVVGWILVGYAAVMSTFGGLLDLPEFLLDLNIFGHLAEYPVEELQWTPIIILTAIGVAGILVGLLGWNRREINRI